MRKVAASCEVSRKGFYRYLKSDHRLLIVNRIIYRDKDLFTEIKILMETNSNRMKITSVFTLNCMLLIFILFLPPQLSQVSPRQTEHQTVNLISPEDNITTNLDNNSLQFVYNHTGTLTGTVNCTLYLDDNPVDYSTEVPANEDKAVYSNRSWNEGDHYWYVNCTDGTTTESSLHIGQNFSFTADFTPPNITSWYTNATNASSPRD
ncbi:MAG: hypothetical protein DRO89_02460, partial [Candidatus Altiarchaeales archaeon]